MHKRLRRAIVLCTDFLHVENNLLCKSCFYCQRITSIGDATTTVCIIIIGLGAFKRHIVFVSAIRVAVGKKHFNKFTNVSNTVCGCDPWLAVTVTLPVSS